MLVVLRMLFVRHGESEWNAVGRWQGQADPPLSSRGRRQARAAASAIGAVDAIVASPLQRALETALILSEELGIGPVLLEPSLVERDAGEWSGLTRSEIEHAFPGYLADGRRPPGYEADHLMLERILAAVANIADSNGDGDVLVVTHGGVIYALEQHLGGAFERKPNLGARWFAWHGDRLSLGDIVTLLDPGAQTVPDLL